MSVYLVDTCIWRDFYENRFSKSGNPIGKYATSFFLNLLNKKDKILFSEGLLRELNTDYKKQDIEDMLNLLISCGVLKRIEITKNEFLEAKQLSENRKIPFIDCLNAVQARNNDAILVTRDEHYFTNLKDIIEAVKPENIK